ncbi:SCO2400 family protein [Streptomyces sp. NPDC004596]
MDYCSSCRRHLNGALVCPGCGAYAPDIAPPAAVSTPDATPGTPAAAAKAHPVDTFDAFGAGDWYDDSAEPGEEPTPASAPRLQPSGAAGGPPATSRGRAARRRQLARWKKNKRRAAVATAFAIVGGGLTLATVDRQSGDRAQAAAAPDSHTMGVAERQTSAGSRPDTAPPSGRHRAPRSAHTPAAPADAPRSASGGQGRHAMAAGTRAAAPAGRADTAATPPPAVTRAVEETAGPVSGTKSGAGSGARTGSGTGAGTGAGSGAGTASGSGGSAAQTPAGSASSNDGGGTGSGTSATSPSPAATSPSQLCLLVVCLG